MVCFTFILHEFCNRKFYSLTWVLGEWFVFSVKENFQITIVGYSWPWCCVTVDYGCWDSRKRRNIKKSTRNIRSAIFVEREKELTFHAEVFVRCWVRKQLEVRVGEDQREKWKCDFDIVWLIGLTFWVDKRLWTCEN